MVAFLAVLTLANTAPLKVSLILCDPKKKVSWLADGTKLAHYFDPSLHGYYMNRVSGLPATPQMLAGKPYPSERLAFVHIEGERDVVLPDVKMKWDGLDWDPLQFTGGAFTFKGIEQTTANLAAVPCDYWTTFDAPSRGSVSARVGYAAGDWQTIATYNGATKSSAGPMFVEKAILGQIPSTKYGSGWELAIRVPDSIQTQDYRIIALDKSGREIPEAQIWNQLVSTVGLGMGESIPRRSRESASFDGHVMRIAETLQPQLLAKTAVIELQTRPYTWVTFPHVRMRPS